ncbi:MAG: carbohydrate kinase [Alphaproteobacteria bacterium]|nr:carbohydrate kinase [Alphaproteobacteria bacterium]
MNYYIGLDSGGTFMKAGLFDRNGKQVALARVAADVVTDKDGWVERDLDDLWANACDVIAQLFKLTNVKPDQVKGISISAQGKGVYLLDKEGRNLRRGILSSDSRSLSIVKKWHEENIPNKIYPLTFQTLWTGHPVSIMRWIKENEPDNYEKVGSVMMAHDYLRYRLTGAIHAELTNISESNFFNASTGTYDKALLSLFGIEELWDTLPQILKSDELAGQITVEAASLTGLKQGTPVFGGLFDVVATAVCSGIDAQTSKLNYVMGTWSVTSGITTDITRMAHNFVYGYHAVENQFIVHEASPTSASNYEWFSNYLSDNGSLDHAMIASEVSAVNDENHELFFVPFLYGSNMGLGIKSGFYGLQSHHKRGDLVKAIWQGILFCHNVHLQRMRQRFPEANILRVTGGPTASPEWMQMLADLTGMSLEIPAIEETGSLAAATMAMLGTGEHPDLTSALAGFDSGTRYFQPDSSKFDLYQKKYQRYLKLVALFKEFEDSKHD